MSLPAPLIPRLKSHPALFLPRHVCGGCSRILSSMAEPAGQGGGRQAQRVQIPVWYCLAVGSWASYSTALSGSSTPIRRLNANSAIDALPAFPLNSIRVCEHTSSPHVFMPNGRHPWLRLLEPRTALTLPGNLHPSPRTETVTYTNPSCPIPRWGLLRV